MTDMSHSDRYLLNIGRKAFVDGWDSHRKAKPYFLAGAVFFAGVAVTAFAPPAGALLLTGIFGVMTYGAGRAGWHSVRGQQAYEKALTSELEGNACLTSDTIAARKWTKTEMTNALEQISDLHQINRLLARAEAYGSFDQDRVFKLEDKLRTMDEVDRLEQRDRDNLSLEKAMAKNVSSREDIHVVHLTGDSQSLLSAEPDPISNDAPRKRNTL